MTRSKALAGLAAALLVGGGVTAAVAGPEKANEQATEAQAAAHSPTNPAGKTRGWAKNATKAAEKKAAAEERRAAKAAARSEKKQDEDSTSGDEGSTTTATEDTAEGTTGKGSEQRSDRADEAQAAAHSPTNPAGKTRGWAKDDSEGSTQERGRSEEKRAEAEERKAAKGDNGNKPEEGGTTEDGS